MCVKSQKVALNSFSGLKSNGASSAASSHFGGESLAMLQRSPVFARYGLSCSAGHRSCSILIKAADEFFLDCHFFELLFFLSF
jgi:hypothetical protein